ncbi:12514_t:CDS:2 [Cetraspora pellucida]|uniref:12514_t:CDS:1 n=1 Tax=Cetraspora pellucida TaxID=1433469 RepID=A0A9N9A0P3_9GLOM|nr:12514_t:CDS:2 [Cetraspora pellucida]
MSTEGNQKSKILNHGILIGKHGLRIADEPVYEFENQPRFSEYPDIKSQIKLVFSTKREKAFLNIKPLEKLNNAIINALNHHNPYHELLKVFKTYGHFLPKSIMLGHELYRTCYLNMKEGLQERNEVLEDFDLTTYNHILNQWENYIKLHDEDDIDTSFLISVNNDKVKRDQLEKWIDSCLKTKINSWKVINWKGLYPLYKILDERLQKDIKQILEVGETKGKERVLMTGVIPIKDFSCYHRVKFSVDLDFNDYKIFGKLVTKNGEQIDTVIKFQSMSISGFSVIIDNFDTNKIFTDSQITWVMIGMPSEIGFFSINTRNLSVLASGSHTFKYNEDYKYALSVPKEFPETSIICVTIFHPSSHYEMKCTIQDSNKNGNEINIIINEDKVEYFNSDEKISSNGDEEISSDEDNDDKIPEDDLFSGVFFLETKEL